MNNYLVIVGAAILVGVVIAYVRLRKSGRAVPDAIRQGNVLPDFSAVDESGGPVRSTDLRGTAAVVLFVRGNWCPFCTSQVKGLSAHYKDIVDLGARLILVTPKPLETTRRVATFFEVDFDFWLDADLSVARQLGLVHESGVPTDHHKEYGEDTIWPTSLVVDQNGIIRYTQISRMIIDRPNPALLLQELRAAMGK